MREPFEVPIVEARQSARLNGVEYAFTYEHRWDDQVVLKLALKLAVDRGGQTIPVCDFDIDRAREIVTGEINEIARLRKELAEARAEASALRSVAARIEP